MALLAHKGAVDLLLKILESRNARISGAILQAGFGDAAGVLLGSGLLTKVGQANIVPDMDDHEDVPTRVEWSPEQESHGYYGRGGKWVSVPAEDLSLHGVKMPALLSQLLVRCERVKPPVSDPLVPDILWDLGTIKLEARGKPVSVWFARRLFDDGHRMRVEEMAAKRPPAAIRVILTSSHDCADVRTSGHLTVSILDIAEESTGFVIDAAALATRMRLVPSSVLKPLRHSVDYGLIYVTEEPFEFPGDLHRRVLKILVDAYNRGKPVCRTAAVLEKAGAKGKNKHLYRVFSKNKDWQKFIKEKGGNCWIEF